MQVDMKLFIIVGLFFIMVMSFFSSIARGQARKELEISSSVSVFNLFVLIFFVMAYLVMTMMVLQKLF